jgi:hypothetical protein
MGLSSCLQFATLNGGAGGDRYRWLADQVESHSRHAVSSSPTVTR